MSCIRSYWKEHKVAVNLMYKVLIKIDSILIMGLSWMNRILRDRLVEPGANLVIRSEIEVRAAFTRSVLITTFEKRFFTNALPLVRELRRQIPDIPILVFINGNLHGDHDRYLRSEFLKALSNISNIDVVCNGRMTGISRNWNLGIQLASTEQVLCLSDDIQVGFDFYKDVDLIFKRNESEGLSIVESFACFFIHRKLIDQIGWFDERYLGFGAEDGDYLWRFEEHFGIPPYRYKLDSFSHQWQEERGDEVAGAGKYSLANFTYNDLKYVRDENGLKGPYSEEKKSLFSNEGIHPMEDFRRKTSGALLETNPERVSEILSLGLHKPSMDF